MKNDIFEQIKVEVVKCAMALNDCADLKDVKKKPCELWLSYYMAEDCTALDLEHLGIWGKKRCKKNFKIDDSGVLYTFILEFYEESENFVKTGVYPVLVIEKLTPTRTDGVYGAHYLKEERLGETVKRKSVKILQDLTANYTEEKAVSMIRELVVA